MLVTGCAEVLLSRGTTVNWRALHRQTELCLTRQSSIVRPCEEEEQEEHRSRRHGGMWRISVLRIYTSHSAGSHDTI